MAVLRYLFFFPVIFILMCQFLDDDFCILFLCWLRESGAQLNSGIEGILNRLQKERNTIFGFNLGSTGYGRDATTSNDPQDWERFQTSVNGKVVDLCMVLCVKS